MDQYQSMHVREVLAHYPSASRSFVGPLVVGGLVLPVVSGLLWIVAARAGLAGPVTVVPEVALAVAAAAGLCALAALICLIVGSIRLLSALQAHLRIGQYHA
ncbi:hypothetical protein C8046_10570 [Serinibacter arcticus]|uniref:Uncharacterized protein n=1 Tax=Serinibacter arcticus TaxID=1655435 RepID=A0A2U1ZVK5_9MICO|nr:hypothetical protein [Serinibacter arcticus]PWD51025.1 hypothetical protein C8046_10570 [Serinibacter arcticus]